jgi:tetratricopeptide (TPR) repeat protein
MASSRRFFVGLLCSALLLPSSLAFGQSSVAKAEALFDKAIQHMDAGRYDEACAALTESQRLASTPGTVYALADCEATRGKIEPARENYKKYLALFSAMKTPLRERHEERARLAEAALKRLSAEELFNKAVEHMDAGRFGEACAALTESQQIDAAPGTLYALADCEATRGRIATAHEHYVAYLKIYAGMKGNLRDRHVERARTAEAQRKKLEPDLPRLKLVWVGPVPDGLDVQRGGDRPGPVTLGVVFPVDPGEHVFVTRVPGKPELERKVRLGKGERKILELTPGEAKVIEDNSGKVTPTKKVVQDKPTPTRAHPWKVGGGVAMGLGAAALAAGGVMGYLALQQKGVVDDACDANFVCGTDGMKEVERFWLLGNTSTALFVAGGAVAATGLVFVLLAPKAADEKKTGLGIRTIAAPGLAFVGVEGAF